MGNVCNPEDEDEMEGVNGNIENDEKKNQNDGALDCCPQEKLDERTIRQNEEFKTEIDRLSQPGAAFVFTKATFYRISIDLKGWHQRLQQFGVACHATGADNPLHVIIILTANDNHNWLTEFNSSGVRLKYIGNSNQVQKMLEKRKYIIKENSNIVDSNSNENDSNNTANKPSINDYTQYQHSDTIEHEIKSDNPTFGNCATLAQWFKDQNKIEYSSIFHNCVDYAIKLGKEIEMDKDKISKLRGKVMFVRDAVRLIERTAPVYGYAGFDWQFDALGNIQHPFFN